DVRRTAHGAAAFADIHGVEPDPVAVESKGRAALIERLSVGRATLDGHGAESERVVVFAGQVKFTRELTHDLVVVNLERVAKTLDVAPDGTESGVHFFPAIASRKFEREFSVGVDLRAVTSEHRIGDGDIPVL